MKSFFLILLMMTSLSSHAGVKEDVVSLGKLAFGTRTETVLGKSAEAMFERWIQYDRKEFVTKEIDDMNDGDEVDFGFTSVKSAQRMSEFAEGHYVEFLDQVEEVEAALIKSKVQKLHRNWAPFIQKLHNAGVKFAYTGNGPGYCGVSFIELVVIDVRAQQVHTIFLSKGGPC